ncbi:MAG: DegV family protein [Candidatus Kariarchaeaceae archaeon]|jgi:DegV family protein with EDD domain
MSEKIGIVTDSACCIQEYSDVMQYTEAHLVPVFVMIDKETISFKDITLSDYYSKIQADTKIVPKTSAATSQELLRVYEKMKESGYTHILSIHAGSGLSGTTNSANVASGMIDDIEIAIIDTGGVATSELAVNIKAKELIDKGIAFIEIVAELEEFSNDVKMYGVVETLDWIRRIGRLSAVKYRLGKLMRVKPVTLTANGKVTAFDKARKLDDARDKMYNYISEGFTKDEELKYVIGYSRSFDHSNMPEIAKKFEKRIKDQFPKARGYIGEFGILMVTATGPGALGVTTYR